LENPERKKALVGICSKARTDTSPRGLANLIVVFGMGQPDLKIKQMKVLKGREKRAERKPAEAGMQERGGAKPALAASFEQKNNDVAACRDLVKIQSSVKVRKSARSVRMNGSPSGAPTSRRSPGLSGRGYSGKYKRAKNRGGVKEQNPRRVRSGLRSDTCKISVRVMLIFASRG